eukprot:CAMPEP_0119411782 /NCGR_PEP_ID=MMETSP1335-20130426/4419_1 /TAXON_ID=259385 /ORGANISM="Chrysoculter rhomboideus, Strain RCC1486" /LENGTH=174 /DNA_ID=CAMNT_0007436451 /DNA_START=67 /DNA_END=592 /DNA_ORIENTATION=+
MTSPHARRFKQRLKPAFGRNDSAGMVKEPSEIVRAHQQSQMPSPMTMRAMMAQHQAPVHGVAANQTSDPREEAGHLSIRQRAESGRSPIGMRPSASTRSPMGIRPPATIRRDPSLRRDDSSGIFGPDIDQHIKAPDDAHQTLREALLLGAKAHNLAWAQGSAALQMSQLAPIGD